MNLNKLYKILYKYVTTGKEKTRYADRLCGVYHDRGNLVACNTHTLFVLDAAYDPVKEGSVLDKKGKPITAVDENGNPRTYPDYKTVIPKNLADARLILSKDECEELVKACSLIPKSKDTSKQVYIRIGNLATVDPKIVVDVAEAFAILGEKFDVLVFTERDAQYLPVVFDSRSSASIVVTMPFCNVESCVSVQEALEVGDLL